MSKFPHLEQLRAERERHEGEITAPYRQQIDGLAELVSRQQATIRSMERVLGSEIGKAMADQIGYQIAGEIRRHIFEAVAKSDKASGGSITITLPLDVLRFSDPASTESEILRRYTHENVPRLRLGVTPHPQDAVTVIDIRIPELGYRQRLAH